MGDILGKLVRSKRKIEQRTTNANKNVMINELNKYSKDFGFEPISKTANVKEVNHAKKIYDTRLAYDIVLQAIKEGNTVIASTYNVDLKRSDDRQDKLIADYAPQLAQAKKYSDKKLTTEEQEKLSEGNQHIKGYGDLGIVKLVEQVKTKGQMEKLIDEIKTQNPREMFYDSKLETFERVFQKIEGLREEDLNKLKEHLKGLDFEGITNATNYLFQSLEMYGSDQSHIGKYDEEQELKNARLDDLMIRFGLKDSGKRIVSATLKKYKTET